MSQFTWYLTSQEFISIYVNVDQQSIYIATDAGRLCRPLIIVEAGRSKVEQKHIEVCCCTQSKLNGVGAYYWLTDI